MRAPAILDLSACFLAAPLAAGLWRRVGRGPRMWVVAWAGVLTVEAAVEYALARSGARNIWIGYLLGPIAGALVLWALSLWQVSPVGRLTYRVAIPVIVAVFAVLTLAFDSASTFSRAAQPMLYLVCLAAAAYTLVTRSLAESGDLMRKDWFWTCGGMTLYFGTFGSVGPVSGLLLHDPVLFRRAYVLASWLMIVSFLAVAKGIACPVET